MQGRQQPSCAMFFPRIHGVEVPTLQVMKPSSLQNVDDPVETDIYGAYSD